MKDRILMAMSGGIDSGVAAMLLLEQGYELVGVTFRNFDAPCHTDVVDPVLEARQLAERLGFEHHTLDVRDLFRQTVIRNFIEEYMCCRTPNPCVVCNDLIKWGALMPFAEKLQCKGLATGHYARIGFENGRHFVRRAKDNLKDQSYFLWKLKEEYLAKTLFPLGDYTKQEVREIAAAHGFVKLSQKKESEDICFVPDNDYRSFLEKEIPDIKERQRPGKMVDKEGKKIGQHVGLYNYTIGQRKGLGIALGVPAYVTELDAARNRVVIGFKDDLLANELVASNVNLVKHPDFEEGQSVECRIRYKSRPVPANIFHYENNCIRVVFQQVVESVTPGQSAVFYEGDDLLGGGQIL